MSRGPSAERCRLIADVAVVARGATLFVRYRDIERYDGEAGWFLPDDFLRHGEHPDRAARRILKEQLGVSARPALSFIESLDGEPWHLVFHYAIRFPGRPSVRAGPALRDARWFSSRALPERRDVAHGGWGLDVLRRIRATSRR